MRIVRVFPLLFITALPACADAAPDGTPGGRGAAGDRVVLTYVGNEGFLVAADGRKVLVDALYRGGVSGYVVIPEERRRLLEGALPPFDGVDLLLATHHHADHFDPQAVGAHLKKNPGARFFSTRQAVERLRSEFAGFDAVRDRVEGVTPGEGERARRSVRGIELEILTLHHGRDRPIENLGFLFVIGGRKMLHVGDTEATADDFAVYDLAAERIDVAFLPFWHLIGENRPAAVRSAIRSERIVVMHVPPREADDPFIAGLGGWESMLSGIERAFPRAIVFREEMGVKRIPGRGPATPTVR